MKNIFILFITMFLFLGCGENEKEKQKIEIENTKKVKDILLSTITNLQNEKKYEEALDEISKYNKPLDNEIKIIEEQLKAKLKELTILELNKKLKEIKSTEIQKNIDIYTLLVKEDGKNQEYVEKMKYFIDLDKKQKEIELNKKISNMVKTKDDIKDIEWYIDKTSPKHRDTKGFYLYFSKNNLRLVMQYYSKDWLFIKSVIIKTDNNKYNFSPIFDRDHSAGFIWEWADMSVSTDGEKVIEDIINSKTVKIRYEGKQYYEDVIIKEAQKKALKNTLEAYRIISDIDKRN